jgi:hypothetical protein
MHFLSLIIILLCGLLAFCILTRQDDYGAWPDRSPMPTPAEIAAKKAAEEARKAAEDAIIRGANRDNFILFAVMATCLAAVGYLGNRWNPPTPQTFTTNVAPPR